ncbi:hypothetical protein [Xanthobacter sp. ZOL 2024]
MTDHDKTERERFEAWWPTSRACRTGASEDHGRDIWQARAALDTGTVPEWRSVLRDLLDYTERNECTHEETHRGGVLWTICDCCGRKWADDEGGFTPYVEPHQITAARELIAAAPQPPASASADEVMSVDDAWRDLTEKDDRTSPDDRPDMALITREERADYMASSNAGKAKPVAVSVKPLPMEEAPKDGTWIALLIAYGDEDCSFPLEDSNDPQWTLGSNNFENDEIDEWYWMGWDWCHDCICETRTGTPIGWMPFPNMAAHSDAYRQGAEEMPAAWHDVLAERRRQVSVEEWTPDHDDEYESGELALAAAAYAENTASGYDGETCGEDPPYAWPWADKWWKPTTRRRDLVKAGALILAEIERLDRAIALPGDKEG